MRVAARPFRRFLAVAAVWAAAIAGAAAARADDAPPSPPAPAAPSAVARLSAEESGMLARRFPDWERKPAAERERIATNVLRLRDLPAEQHARFFERLRRVEAAGPAVLADLPDRLATYGRLRPEERARAKEGGRIERAILGAVRAELSPQALAVIDAKEGAAPAERMVLFAGIVAHVRQRAGQPLQGTAIPESVPGLSTEEADWLQRTREKVARGEALPPRERARLGFVLMQARLRQAAGTVPAPTPDLRPDARLGHERALSKAVGEAFPEAVKAVVADVEAAAARGREGLYEYARQHAPTRPREPSLWGTVTALERVREFLADDARAKVDEAQVALLQALRVPDEDVAKLRAAKSAAERGLLLWDLQQRLRPSRDASPPSRK